MEVISIERSTYEELLTSFNSFVSQMKAMADRGTDKRLGEWLDNQDVCQILNISPRTLQTLRDNGTLAYSPQAVITVFNFLHIDLLLRFALSINLHQNPILGLRFGNLTPSPILPNLLFDSNCTSSFFPSLPLFLAELR